MYYKNFDFEEEDDKVVEKKIEKKESKNEKKK